MLGIKSKKQREADERTAQELAEYLIYNNLTQYPELGTIYAEFQKLQQQQLMSNTDIVRFFHTLFSKNTKQFNFI